MTWLRERLPIAAWLPHYERAWLRPDLVAGLTSWALVVPQAVAYGAIAGLPAQAGLAAAFAGPLAYGILGTCRQMMVSPTSSTAAVSAALVGALAAGDAQRFLSLSAALAIFTGLVLALLGVFRLGFVSQFLATAVQVGFMFGLGLTICVGQLFKLFGIPAPTDADSDFIPSVLTLVRELRDVHAWTFVLGASALLGLIVMKRYMPRAPAALIVVVVSIVVTTLLGLHERGVATVGAIEPGLPVPGMPIISWADVQSLLPVAVALAVLGYAESASVAQGFATRHRYEVDPNQELIALGGSNALAGLVRGFMVAGGASQSAANDRAGARTQVASLCVAGLTVVTAYFLTGLFFNLPQAVLAAIVIDAVRGFFRTDELQRLARLRRDSFVLAIVALVGVLLLGMLGGLILAVGLTLLALLNRLSRPSVSVLGRAPDSSIYADTALSPELSTAPGLLVVRPNVQLMFANARFVRNAVLDLLKAQQVPPRAVVLSLEMSHSLDVESADTLAELRDTLRERGSDLWLAVVHRPVEDILYRNGFFATDGPRDSFPTVEAAVQSAEGAHAALG